MTVEKLLQEATENWFIHFMVNNIQKLLHMPTKYIITLVLNFYMKHVLCVGNLWYIIVTRFKTQCQYVAYHLADKIFQMQFSTLATTRLKCSCLIMIHHSFASLKEHNGL